MRNNDPCPITYAEVEDMQAEIDRLRAENAALLKAAEAAVWGHKVVISNGGTGWTRHVEEPLWELHKLLAKTAKEGQ